MRLQAKCTWGVALVVLAFAVALSALAGCGGKAQETDATGGDVFGFMEFLVPVIELSKCVDLSAAAQEFETNTRGNVDLRREAKEFQRFVDVAPDEIRGDLQTFADAVSKWAEAVERAEGLKGADLANPTQETLKQLKGISARVDRQELKQATHNVVVWMDENCG
jgi:hypothetical protein